jgi:hypothetical protein
MKKPAMFRTGKIGECCWILTSILATVLPSYGQKFDVTPLFGGRFGGTLQLQPQGGSTQSDAKVNDSFIYGVAGGIRFDGYDGCDGCEVIEFRWLRQNTHLGLANNLLLPTPLTGGLPNPAVTFDHFMVDFTHEFQADRANHVRPYLTASLGAARMGAPAGGAGTRFVFGLGSGVKIFPHPRWGFRIGVEYLPMVMHASVQSIICSSGCIVTLNGGLMNQFQLTAGPIFRF